MRDNKVDESYICDPSRFEWPDGFKPECLLTEDLQALPHGVVEG